MANEVVRLVNIERAANGAAPLNGSNSSLTQAANLRSKELVANFSHTRPNGAPAKSVTSEFNISWGAFGENIAYGQTSAQSVVQGWMNSPGHRRNILSPDFTSIGVGVYESNGILYWTQLFIG